MRGLYLLSVWLHLVAVIVWLGGMLFLVLVLIPAIRRPEYREIFSPLIHRVGVRYRWIGWIALAVLVLSGITNLAYRGFGWADLWSGRLWQGPFGRTLGIKLLLVAIVFALSALHDFLVGPRATALGRADPSSPEALRWRRRAAWIGRINMLLALIIVALGVALVRGGL